MDGPIILSLNGKPQGKGRPRHGKGGRVYTPQATKLAEAAVEGAWVEAGRPRIEGPVKIHIWLAVARPKGHYLRDGSLSTAGKRAPHPTKKPDVDNVLKLVMDALNGKAYHDDAQVVHALVWRRWSTNRWESTAIMVEPLT